MKYPIFWSVLLLGLLGACQSPSSQSEPTEMVSGRYALNGIDQYVHIEGQGTPILIVHGGPGLDHSYIQPHLGKLADGFQLIYLDQRASGKSAIGPAQQITVAQLVSDMEALRDTLGIDQWHVLGHSWGGFLGLQYAAAHPNAVESLILMNSLGVSTADKQQETASLGNRETAEDSAETAKILQSAEMQSRSPRAFEQLFEVSFRKEFFRRELADSLHIHLSDSFVMQQRAMLQGLGPELQEYDFSEMAAELQVPTLLIYGDHDPLMEISGPKLAELIPENEFVVLSECGHFPFIERPDTLMEVISAWADRE
ncbi:alpha/beta hydrolase [Pontibacter sp. G13]|uniref:alpha/beta fold hydrolase n=1 Tax=Pontibacter sp. G13 TaxID=3074898 RepID=UPI00288BF6B4|nr:alpha/beta hydrolase [Pontibacter sp. G13]WNJ17803.1 alpha/beta hydrolase [Pontibacter sp. G13]